MPLLSEASSPWAFAALPRPAGTTPGASGSFDDPTLACLHPATRAMARYWQAKCDADRPPSRADIDPRQIAAILRYVVMADVVPVDDGGRRYRFRLVGTEPTSFYGNVTGKYVDAVLAPESLARHLWILERVTGERRPLRNVGRVQLPGKDWLISEALATPLATAGVVDIVLAAVVVWPETQPPFAVQQAWLAAAR